MAISRSGPGHRRSLPLAGLRLGLALGLGFGLVLGQGCDAFEPAQVSLEVVTDASGLEPAMTDLGYTVELTEARIAIEDVVFAVGGEEHASALDSALEWVVPTARAHPGHFTDGDVTGELLGRFVLEWPLPGAEAGSRASLEPLEVGSGSLLVGDYRSFSFGFARADAADGLDELDPLLGHTALLRGVATRDEVTVPFEAYVDSPLDRSLVGAPFELSVTEESRERLGLRLLLVDREGDTLFDGVDFGALELDEGTLRLEQPAVSDAVLEAYFTLRRALQSHDHYDVLPLPGPPLEQPSP